MKIMLSLNWGDNWYSECWASVEAIPRIGEHIKLSESTMQELEEECKLGDNKCICGKRFPEDIIGGVTFEVIDVLYAEMDIPDNNEKKRKEWIIDVALDKPRY